MPKKLSGYGTTAALKKFATRALQGAASGHDHPPGHSKMESIREAEHKGHHIVIRTRYTITVDGRPLQTHLTLDNDGQLACHALPNYSFASAVDLVERLIDLFPDHWSAAPHHHSGQKKRGTATVRKGTRTPHRRHASHR